MPTRKLICCGSRFLSKAEENYAIVEKELLAVQWAVEKARMYLAGSQFTAITDHAPLISILNGKNHDAIMNQRIQRISAKLIGYQFRLLWCKGKTNHVADALSRYPVFQPEPEDCKDVLACTVLARRATEPQEDLAMDMIKEYAKEDEEYNKIYKAIVENQDVTRLPTNHPALKYQGQWHALSVEEDLEGLILYHGRIWIPTGARTRIMRLLHGDHCGFDRCLQKARNIYFWPGMAKKIKTMVAGCNECLTFSVSKPKEPLIMTMADRPFEKISMD